MNRGSPKSDNYFVILHLSDLHFGDEGSRGSIDRRKIFQLLIDKIKNLDDEWKPRVVCITGDIASKNKKTGYEQANQWLNKLVAELDIEKEAVFICPGNHDVDHNQAFSLVRPNNVGDADRVLKFPIAEHYKKLFINYEQFCKDMQLFPYDISETHEHIIGSRTYKGTNYVCANSCWCVMGDDDKGKLWLGLNFVKSLDLPLIENKDSPITIALLHHPREYYAEEETGSYTKQRCATFDYLASRCHVILTGHVGLSLLFGQFFH